MKRTVEIMFKVLKRRTNFKFPELNKSITGIIEHRRLIALTVIFSIGMIWGVKIVTNENSYAAVKFIELFKNYLSERVGESLFILFTNSLFISLVFITVSFIGGLCAVGAPFILFAPFIRGLGMGMISGYLYGSFRLQGLGYSLLIIYPGALISILAMLMCCSESLLMSYEILQTARDKRLSDENSLKMYFARYGVLLSITAVSALIDAICLIAFSRFFSFF